MSTFLTFALDVVDNFFAFVTLLSSVARQSLTKANILLCMFVFVLLLSSFCGFLQIWRRKFRFHGTFAFSSYVRLE